MRYWQPILVLLVGLFLGLALVLPAEDLPQTAYDESQVLPYESTALFVGYVPALSGEKAPDSKLAIKELNPAAKRRAQANLSSSVPFTVLNHSLRC